MKFVNILLVVIVLTFSTLNSAQPYILCWGLFSGPAVAEGDTWDIDCTNCIVGPQECKSIGVTPDNKPEDVVDGAANYKEDFKYDKANVKVEIEHIKWDGDELVEFEGTVIEVENIK